MISVYTSYIYLSETRCLNIYFFPSKRVYIFCPHRFSDLALALLDHTIRTLLFCHGHMSIQERRKVNRFGGKGGWGVSRRSFIKENIFAPIRIKNWRCGGKGVIAPLPWHPRFRRPWYHQSSIGTQLSFATDVAWFAHLKGNPAI